MITLGAFVAGGLLGVLLDRHATHAVAAIKTSRDEGLGFGATVAKVGLALLFGSRAKSE